MNRRSGDASPLLELRDLTIDLARDGTTVRVVDGIDLQVSRGEVVGLVGESGSGKTLTALAVGRLLPAGVEHAAGEIRLAGREVSSASPATLRRIRGGVVSYVFQEPSVALNPVMRIGTQIAESWQQHRSGKPSEQDLVELLRSVGLPAADTRLHQYPHQISGGMQQRVLLAIALASRPALLIADEPTTALDATLQAQIVELLRQLREQERLSILWISHNLGLVGQIADRIAVMYAGQIVETGRTEDLLRRPMHPYTIGLLESVPDLGGARERLASIAGSAPLPGEWPAGCRFHPRCLVARPECAAGHFELAAANPERFVRCPYSKSAN